MLLWLFHRVASLSSWIEVNCLWYAAVGKVARLSIDQLDCSLLGLSSVVSGPCTVVQKSPSKGQWGEQQASLKAALVCFCLSCFPFPFLSPFLSERQTHSLPWTYLSGKIRNIRKTVCNYVNSVVFYVYSPDPEAAPGDFRASTSSDEANYRLINVDLKWKVSQLFMYDL